MTTQRRLFGAAYETKKKEQQNGGKKKNSRMRMQSTVRVKTELSRRRLVKMPGKDRVAEHCADEELMVLSKKRIVRGLSKIKKCKIQAKKVKKEFLELIKKISK